MHSLGYRTLGADAAFLHCQSAAVRRHDLWSVRSCIFVGAMTKGRPFRGKWCRAVRRRRMSLLRRGRLLAGVGVTRWALHCCRPL
jgi:hypothetical protein